jgi:hypothetical protein
MADHETPSASRHRELELALQSLRSSMPQPVWNNNSTPSATILGDQPRARINMAPFTSTFNHCQAWDESDETPASLHDFFIHHIPAPTASQEVVREWIKTWFVGTTAGTRMALNTSATPSTYSFLDMEALKKLCLNGMSIRELRKKAVELHLKQVFLIEGVADAIAADIQRAKKIEAEEEEKLIAVSKSFLYFYCFCFQSWAWANCLVIYRNNIFETQPLLLQSLASIFQVNISPSWSRASIVFGGVCSLVLWLLEAG